MEKVRYLAAATTATVVLEASSRTIVSSQTGEGPSAHCLSHEVIKPTKPNQPNPTNLTQPTNQTQLNPTNQTNQT